MSNNTTITIVGFGNSITEATSRMPDASKRWLNVLQRSLVERFPDKKFNIANAGVGGNSAREAMQRFDRDVLAHDPDFVLLEFGGNNNDLARPERRVALDEFSSLLEDCRCRLPAKTCIIVITFPPLIEEQTRSYNNPYVREHGGPEGLITPFRNITRDFAARYALPLVDFDRELRLRMAHAAKNHYTLDDGVHLTEAGNAVLAELVFDALIPLI